MKHELAVRIVTTVTVRTEPTQLYSWKLFFTEPALFSWYFGYICLASAALRQLSDNRFSTGRIAL